MQRGIWRRTASRGWGLLRAGPEKAYEAGLQSGYAGSLPTWTSAARRPKWHMEQKFIMAHRSGLWSELGDDDGDAPGEGDDRSTDDGH